MYSQRTITSLRPDWWEELSKKQKKRERLKMIEQRDEMWNNKPKPIPSGTIISARETTKNISEGKGYKVINYFATLVTTVYYSDWREFVTLKNDKGYTVKMNVNNFRVHVVERGE